MDKRLKNISKVSVALALCAASATATIAIPKTDNVMAAAKKTAKYGYSVQTKKITRTIKMYQPKGLKKVVQKAYIKRTVKTNKKTKKKTYGKWSTSSWKKYKVAKVSGYTASRATIGAAKVTRKTKNQTVKITYKAIKKAAKKTNKKRTTKKAIKKPAKKTVKKPVRKLMPKKTIKKPVKKTIKKATPASANLTFYTSSGKRTSFWPAKDGLEKAPKKGDKVEVLGQGIINGQLMYQIAQNSDVYVPAKDVKVDYFKNVHFVDYYHGSGTPAQNKAAYDARLARIEKYAGTGEDTSAGLLEWTNAHPLENLRMWSKKTKVSKNTYEKHNLTYAQAAAEDGRMSVGYTKESYTAYIKGEAAYRQYEAKWATEHPNITKNMEELFKNDSDYKKYNLNTFEWHYNDNFYVNIRK